MNSPNPSRHPNKIPQVLLFLFITHKFFSFRPAGVDFSTGGDSAVIREFVMGLTISAAAGVVYLTRRVSACRAVADLQFAFGIMIAAGLISLLWTPAKEYAFYNLLQLGTLLTILSLFEFGSGDNCRREAMRMLNVALAGNLVFLTPVIWSAVTGGADAGGRASADLNLFHPAKMGELAGALCAYFTVAFLIGANRLIPIMMAAGVCGFALFASGGKGGVAAATISVIVVVSTFVRPKTDRILMLGTLMIVALPIAMAMNYGLFVHLEKYSQLSNHSDVTLPTLVFRFQMWSAAIQSCFKSVPIFLFGNGPGFSASQTFDLVVNGQTFQSTGAHQSVLQTLSEFGIVGGGAFLALIVITMKRVIRRRMRGSFDPASAPIFAGWLALLISGMLDQVYSLPVGNQFCLFVALMTALTLIIEIPGTPHALP